MAYIDYWGDSNKPKWWVRSGGTTTKKVYRRKRYRITRFIVNTWDDIWFEWHYPTHIRYGGGRQGYKTFKTANLAILISIICFILLLLIYLK